MYASSERRWSRKRPARPSVNAASAASTRAAPSQSASNSSDPHLDCAPLPLPEAEHTEDAPRDMTRQNRQPDIDRVELPQALYHEADAQRHEDLRNHRDVERALRVPGPLQSPRVCQGDSDEQSGDAQHAEQLDADIHDDGVVHSKDCE